MSDFIENCHEGSRSQSASLSQKLWCEIVEAGKQAGPLLQTAVSAGNEHPVEAAIGIGTLTLVGVGIAAESPLLIGIAGACAVSGALYEGSAWALFEVKKLQKDCGLR